MGRTFAIGDIHGDFDALERVLEQLPTLAPEDTLVFMGDYLDRGPKSKEVVDLVRRLPAESPAQVVALRGNHEDAWLRILAGGWAEFILPRSNGCLETARSFMGRPMPADLEMPTRQDMDALLSGSFFPEDVVAWMTSLPFYYEDEHAIYVHAGIPKSDGTFPHPAKVDPQIALLWCRDKDFFRNYSGKRVVFGHTATDSLPPELSSYTPEDPADMWAGPCTVGLDTGCGKGGFLTALELPAMQVYESQVEEVTVITAHDLVKSFGTTPVLDGASVAIDTGERVGLVGINGSGKSTLARILAGVQAPDGGTVARRRGAEVAYLPQEPTFDEGRSAREVVLAGLHAWMRAKERHDAASRALAAGEGVLDSLLEEQTAAAAEVERLGGWDRMHQVDEVLEQVGVQRTERAVGTLSGGDRRRVALARILVAAPGLAVLDEPSNHLDVETIEWLERYLVEQHRGALLLITHDRYLLDRVVTRTLELARGKLYAYDGGYEAYLEAKAERAEHEARTESNRQNFLRRELEWLRRQPKARTGKQKARIGRAEAAQAAVPPRAERGIRLEMDATRTGKTILELKRLGLVMGGVELVRGLDLTVTPGERIGVVGRNGTGKTTLLRAIAGEVAASNGDVTLGKNTNVAYFDQNRAVLDDAASIFDNVAGGRSRVETFGESVEVRSFLERFLFDPQKQRQPVGSLSGGERARVALAKLLSHASNLVLLDEPTNDLDVATLGALENMLVDFTGCVIVVTHDRWFLDRVATAILAFEGGAKVTRYAGNYDAYRTRRLAIEAADVSAEKAAAVAPKGARPKPTADASGARPLTYAERLELEGLLDRVEGAEKAVAELEALLADPSVYSTRGADVPGLVAQLSTARAEASRLTARWEELEVRKGAGR